MDTPGARIKRYRNEKRLTQKELAAILDVDHSTVSNWERDVYEPDVKSLKDLAKLFDISVDELIGNNFTKSERELTKDIENDALLQEIKEKYDLDITTLTDEDWNWIVSYVQAAKLRKKE